MSVMEDIRAVAEEVREKCLDFALSEDSIGFDFHGEEDLDMMCAVASASLVRELRRRGIGRDPRVVEGQYKGMDEHCWVEAGEYVVDITASQFHGPKVLVEQKANVRDIYQNGKKPRLKDWPKYQKADAITIVKILNRHR